MSWQFKWLRDWNTIWQSHVLPEWHEMAESAVHSHPYHRPEVIRHWAETCGNEDYIKPMFGIAQHDEKRCLLPWVTTTHHGRFGTRRRLEYVGHDVFGYHDPLSSDTEEVDWAGFWEAVRFETTKFCDQSLLRFVHPRYGTGSLATPSLESSPLLDLQTVADFQDLMNGCSANHRGDVRRRIRRLEEQGPLSLWVAGQQDADVASNIFATEFLTAYGRYQQHRSERYLFKQPGVRQFAERIVKNGVREGWGSFAVLRVGDVSVAWHLGFLHRQQLYWWIPVFDAAWADFSVGKVLLAKLIEHGFQNGWSRIHFMTGDHAYKLAWKPQPLQLRAVRWHSPSVRGQLYSVYDSFARRKARV